MGLGCTVSGVEGYWPSTLLRAAIKLTQAVTTAAATLTQAADAANIDMLWLHIFSPVV